MPITLDEAPELRWFDEFPKCFCGKKSQGILRGSQNESWGHHCKACATKRLENAKRARRQMRARI